MSSTKYLSPLPEPTLSEAASNELENQRLEKLEKADINESDVLGGLHTNLGAWTTYWTNNTTRAKEDSKFLYESQWSAAEKSEFVRLQKTYMEANQLHDPFRKIIAEERKNPPGIAVRSKAGKATQKQIDLHEDILKTISYDSDALISYEIAFKNAVSRGWGAIQVNMDYESNNSFDKKVFYELINNVNDVFWDPRAQKKSKEDGDYCGKIFQMTREEFNAAYPNIDLPQSFSDPFSIKESFVWLTKETVGVCDYWVKEWFTKEIVELDNQQKEVITREEYDELEKEYNKTRKIVTKGFLQKIKHYKTDQDAEMLSESEMPTFPQIRQSRITQDYRINYYRCIQNKIVDFREWPGTKLPLIYVDGDSEYLEGMQNTYSFIHYAKDTQRFINYVHSEVANQIKSCNHTRFLVTPDNVIGHEQAWKNPDSQVGGLLYNPDTLTQEGPIIVPPQEISQSLLMQYQRAVNDLKAIIGFYDVNLGAESGETSGIAIQNRGIQGGLSAFIYYDNLAYAVKQAALVVLDLMPNVYDNPRTFSIKRDSGDIDNLKINQPFPDGSIRNQLEKLDFDIEITPSAASVMQKQQMLQTLLQLVQTYPPSAPLVGDIIAKNLDSPDMPTLVERFQTLLPPQIVAKEKGMPPPPPQPNPAEQEIQMKMQEIKMKIQDQQLEHKRKTMDIMQKQDELEHRKKMEQLEFSLESLKVELAAKEAEGNLGINMVRSSTEITKAKMDHATELLKVGHTIQRNRAKDLQE